MLITSPTARICVPSLSSSAAELLEGPAGELDHHVVARGRVLLQRPVAPVGDLVQRQAAGQQRRDEGDGEAGGLGGQGRRARGARVDLDDHHAAGLRIVGELDVGAADHLDRLDDVVGVLLQPLLQLRGRWSAWARCSSESPVCTPMASTFSMKQTVIIWFLASRTTSSSSSSQPRTDSSTRIWPTRLAGEPALGDDPQLLHVVDQPAAGAAHRVGRADDDGIAELRGDLLGLFHACGDLAARHVDAQPVHRLLEAMTVLAALDGVDLHADHLDAVLVQHARRGAARRRGSGPIWPPRFGSSASGAPRR